MENDDLLKLPKAVIAAMQKSQYDYSACNICGKPIEGDDVDEAICDGWDGNRMLVAHKACFAAANPNWIPPALR